MELLYAVPLLPFLYSPQQMPPTWLSSCKASLGQGQQAGCLEVGLSRLHINQNRICCLQRHLNVVSGMHIFRYASAQAALLDDFSVIWIKDSFAHVMQIHQLTCQDLHVGSMVCAILQVAESCS